jgi:hypothetical protein
MNSQYPWTKGEKILRGILAVLLIGVVAYCVIQAILR